MWFQTNEKAEALSDLDTLTRRLSSTRSDESESASLRSQLTAATEAVSERDRTIEQLRQQIKYYVAFAENSLSGRATPPTTREEEAVKQKGEMEVELKEAKVRHLGPI